MKLICAAIFLFTLGACGATIDKHDEHLKEVQREQEIYKVFANMQNSLELKARELKTKRENEAQYNAMIERIGADIGLARRGMRRMLACLWQNRARIVAMPAAAIR